MLYYSPQIGSIKTSVGEIPLVPALLKFRDYLEHMKVRFDIGRMNYRIQPGVYAIGNPDNTSPVFVSANYKLSFDHLRKELQNINGWILVLDTKGINVWCAAGKGTFGTQELIERIQETNLKQLVSHRELIVPQLGATGISAHMVKDLSGFKVTFGPVRAEDIRAFLTNKKRATDGMRRVCFTMKDRALLIPTDLMQGQKFLIPVLLLFYLLSGLDKTGLVWTKIVQSGVHTLLPVLGAYISGAILTPLLLPFLPGRAFSLKGFNMAIPVFFVIYFISMPFQALPVPEKISWFLMMSSLSSFIAMNFTGGSTYTSLTGVKIEMRYAVPLQIAGFALGFIAWIIMRFI